jgi:hypothetical protein
MAALTGYAATHHHAMLIAAWLEGTGTLLQIIFVLARRRVADGRERLDGRRRGLRPTPDRRPAVARSDTAGTFYEVIVRVCGAEVWPPTVTVIVAVPG